MIDPSKDDLDEPFDSADNWRSLARECHEWAEDILDAELRSIMQRIAEAYDELARSTEKRVNRSQLH